MDPKSKALQSAKRAIAAAASLTASAMLARSIVNDYLPHELRDYFWLAADAIRSRLHDEHTILISDKEGNCSNRLYEATRAYLSSKVSPSMNRLWVSKTDDDDTKPLAVSLENGKELLDVFQGIEFRWRFPLKGRSSSKEASDDEADKSFVLTFSGKHKELVMKSYLPHLLAVAREVKAKERALNLYVNDGGHWNQLVKLRHPATFDTLAMDPGLKQSVIDDLARFIKKKDYYAKIGKAWKRGYLLYGPPGTGKSSMVAAIANHLKFDIYDLQLSDVRCNKALQRLLAGMVNKSVLVVEDIDCSTEMMNRDHAEAAGSENRGSRNGPKWSDPQKVTLSGLLNSIDGLGSSSGEERIIVFTTNYKDRLDPALLRPGRMDMHIHMGYCGVPAFRILASNYHGIDKHHPMFPEIEGLIEEVQVTPAEVAEQLMRSDNANTAFKSLIEFLEGKREATEAQSKEED